ncbi:hypothetical protein [Scytonema sp. NUACC26]|uniref:hypothetical protein n=1 Tax=Scytonema sp. NUACC26 TaxID=3140176 RepID=UPI0038B35CF1
MKSSLDYVTFFIEVMHRCHQPFSPLDSARSHYRPTPTSASCPSPDGDRSLTERNTFPLVRV